MLRDYDTVVLLKPREHLASLRAAIAEAGARAVWVQRAGRPEEQVVGDLANVPAGAVDYFSLLIVRGGRQLVQAAGTREEASRP